MQNHERNAYSVRKRRESVWTRLKLSWGKRSRVGVRVRACEYSSSSPGSFPYPTPQEGKRAWGRGWRVLSKDSAHRLQTTSYSAGSCLMNLVVKVPLNCVIYFSISFRWCAFPNFCSHISRPLAYGVRISSKASATAVKLMGELPVFLPGGALAGCFGPVVADCMGRSP